MIYSHFFSPRAKLQLSIRNCIDLGRIHVFPFLKVVAWIFDTRASRIFSWNISALA